MALIDAYFGNRVVNPTEAWRDVYRLLLWADATTGLAHCYESDKSQPGRRWYARTLDFHDWLAGQFGVPAIELVDQLDWMFREVIQSVADREAEVRTALAARAQTQLLPFAQPMPVPGDDPELRQVIDTLLPNDPSIRPSDELIRGALRQVRTHIGSENKRKNLLGRGFEDVLAGIIRRLPAPPLQMGTQTPIADIPGFREPRTGDKSEKVDLWVGPEEHRRVLASAKWSVRADREKQMRGDFLTYVMSNERRDPFEYVWITNEFDPARLVANATNTEANRYLFDAIVHICPDALRVVHELDRAKLPKTPALLNELLNRERIIGLDDWLGGVAS